MREVIEKRVTALLEAREVVVLAKTRELALDVVLRIVGAPPVDLDRWRAQYAEFTLGLLGVKLDIPGSPMRRSRSGAAWLDAQFHQLVREVADNPDATGLVAALVHGRDEQGGRMSAIEVVHNLRTLILAGHETSGSSLCWMAAHASTNPRVWQALVDEVRATPELPATPRDLQAFPFAQALFREAVRYYPPAFMRSRLLMEPLDIDARTVPAGQVMMVPIWLLSRDPGLYTEADRFHPWRWLGHGKKYSALDAAYLARSTGRFSPKMRDTRLRVVPA